MHSVIHKAAVYSAHCGVIHKAAVYSTLVELAVCIANLWLYFEYSVTMVVFSMNAANT